MNNWSRILVSWRGNRGTPARWSRAPSRGWAAHCIRRWSGAARPLAKVSRHPLDYGPKGMGSIVTGWVVSSVLS